MIADDARFPDDGPRAMVHEKMSSNLRARMQVHPRPGVRPLGHDPGNKSDVLQVKLMRESLDGDSFHAGISHNHFFLAESGRVTLEGRFRIRLQQLADPRQTLKEIQCL